MKKKLIIYLLAAVMVLSPAAVFADAAADTPNDDAAVMLMQNGQKAGMLIKLNTRMMQVKSSVDCSRVEWKTGTKSTRCSLQI